MLWIFPNFILHGFSTSNMQLIDARKSKLYTPVWLLWQLKGKNGVPNSQPWPNLPTFQVTMVTKRPHKVLIFLSKTILKGLNLNKLE